MEPFSRPLADLLDHFFLSRKTGTPLFRNQSGKQVLAPWLDRGKELVFPIHPRNELADGIVTEAMRQFAIIGNSTIERGKSKIRCEDAQAFQMLLLTLLEFTEVYQERSQDTAFMEAPLYLGERAKRYAGLFEVDEAILSFNMQDMILEESVTHLTKYRMIVRYLKHLVTLTGDHDLLWPSYGTSQFIFQYSKTELMAMWRRIGYAKLTKDGTLPKMKNFNKDLGDLEKTLKFRVETRFGDFIQSNPIKEQPGIFLGQTTWISDPEIISLATAMLKVLTPWQTTCDRFQKKKWNQFDGIFFVHGFICPTCFSWVVAEGAKAVLPENRLALPTFFNLPTLSNGNGEHSEIGIGPMAKSKHWTRWFTHPSPAPETVEQALDRDSARRKTFVGKELTLFADLRKLQTFSTQSTCTVTIPESTRFLLVKARDSEGWFPLALLALRLGEVIHSFQYRLLRYKSYILVLEGGQELSFRIRVTRNEQGECQYTVQTRFYSPQPPLQPSGTLVWIFNHWAQLLVSLVILVGLGSWLWTIIRKPQAPPLDPVVRHSSPTLPVPSLPNQNPVLPEVPKQSTPVQQGTTPAKNRKKLISPPPPMIYIDCSTFEFEKEYCAALQNELAQNYHWKIVSKPIKGAYILQRDTLLSGSGLSQSVSSFRLELTNSSEITIWSKIEEISQDNYLERVRLTAKQLNELQKKK
ncbi:MAG: hypothetical protein HY774_28560 [Acidobacteria bacterium]|nr:hypothetical protein [Acidobacteriota bacterium]